MRGGHFHFCQVTLTLDWLTTVFTLGSLPPPPTHIQVKVRSPVLSKSKSSPSLPNLYPVTSRVPQMRSLPFTKVSKRNPPTHPKLLQVKGTFSCAIKILKCSASYYGDTFVPPTPICGTSRVMLIWRKGSSLEHSVHSFPTPVLSLCVRMRWPDYAKHYVHQRYHTCLAVENTWHDLTRVTWSEPRGVSWSV